MRNRAPDVLPHRDAEILEAARVLDPPGSRSSTVDERCAVPDDEPDRRVALRTHLRDPQPDLRRDERDDDPGEDGGDAEEGAPHRFMD
jgi:hypothetical protein